MPTITGLDSGAAALDSTLHVRGAPDKFNYRPLTIFAPSAGTGNFDIFMASPPAKEMTLAFVGAPVFPETDPTGEPPLPGVIFQNGVVGLVANGALGSGVPGASGLQNEINLSISSIAQSGFPPVAPSGPGGTDTPLPGVIAENGVLGLTVFSSGPFDQNNNATLQTTGFVRSFPPLPGVIADNSFANLVVQGSGFEISKGFMGISILHFGSENLASGSPHLSIQTDFNLSNNATLHINSRGTRGFMTTSIDGLLAATGNIPLNIDGPTNNNINLSTRGFLE